MSESAVRVIAVGGSHREMGAQHGRQVADLRPAILGRIVAGEERLQQDGAGPPFEQLIAQTAGVLAAHSPATIDLLRGLSAGLDIPYEQLLRYNLAAFLRDVLTTRRRLDEEAAAAVEGCTTWAATGPATADGLPVLAKNRDYDREHLPLQTVVRATPERGYRYTFVTSAGSPGVFVAGFNETGLSVVDTHVPSTDIGPGLPIYALSMHILEEHNTVRSALDFLRATPRLGRNNLLLADATGDVACFEAGYTAYGLREAEQGLLVNTNHFNSPAMAGAYVDTEIPALRGNSQRRYRQVTAALQAQAEQIDLTWGEALMRSHDGAPASICRHPFGDAPTSTIASLFFVPAARTMILYHGLPCDPATPRAEFHY